MTLTIAQWHQRYLQQARWTQTLRSYLYQKCKIKSASKILDVGCGTGVLERELNDNSNSYIFGVDIEFQTIKYAQDYASKTNYIVGDCLSLPFPASSFDVTLCHFLLLWIDRLQNAVEQMVRVTHPGGFVLAMAEPDYGGRIDFPEELSNIGAWQIKSLKSQGANPFIGRQLRSIFSNAGLLDIKIGVLGGQWNENSSADDVALEWQVIESDLENNQEFQSTAEKLKTLELSSRIAQHRILFVPVFYALGTVCE